MTETEARKLANRIVKAIFRNGDGQEADRLILQLPGGYDGGGWGRGPVTDIIVKILLLDATWQSRWDQAKAQTAKQSLRTQLAEISRQCFGNDVPDAGLEAICNRIRDLSAETTRSAALRIQLAQVTEALGRYGQHDGDCPQCETGVVVLDAPRFKESCTCGLDGALTSDAQAGVPGG